MVNTVEIAKPIEMPRVWDLTHPESLPDLVTQATEIAIDLTSSYWTPEKKDDELRGFFQGVKDSEWEGKDLTCAYFLAQDKSGALTTMRNGSRKLVGSLLDSVASNKLAIGMPLIIRYKGKIKGKKHEYDDWSIRLLNVEEK
jgi:hypothetical protein